MFPELSPTCQSRVNTTTVWLGRAGVCSPHLGEKKNDKVSHNPDVDPGFGSSGPQPGSLEVQKAQNNSSFSAEMCPILLTKFFFDSKLIFKCQVKSLRKTCRPKKAGPSEREIEFVLKEIALCEPILVLG